MIVQKLNFLIEFKMISKNFSRKISFRNIFTKNYFEIIFGLLAEIFIYFLNKWGLVKLINEVFLNGGIRSIVSISSSLCSVFEYKSSSSSCQSLCLQSSTILRSNSRSCCIDASAVCFLCFSAVFDDAFSAVSDLLALAGISLLEGIHRRSPFVLQRAAAPLRKLVLQTC